MDNKNWKGRRLDLLTRKLVHSYEEKKGINQIDVLNLPNSEHVVEIIQDFFKAVFPGFTSREAITSTGIHYYVGNLLESLYDKLTRELNRALEYQCPAKNPKVCRTCDCKDRAGEITVRLLEGLPAIRKLLKEDVRAAFEGDPAAKSFEEVIVSYPFIKAITVQRIAHLLYEEDVPLVPRMMCEWAHKETGIDIHPGARIGRGFFIDHGTGVVIGETTDIGDNVKLYQGVTLGALSFPRDEKGNIIKGAKRHPTLCGDVTVYANATILGGETVIGRGAVIGGNSWITAPVKPGAVVTIAEPKLTIRVRKRKK